MGIGGYIQGNNDYARFAKTSTLRKISQAAEEAFKKDSGKIATPEVEAFLKTLGKRGEGALKNLPKDGMIDFISAHGGMQLITGDNKNIIRTCEKLKNPLLEFFKTVPKRLSSLLKMTK